MVDAVLDGVLTTRLASRCGISTPKVGTATQLSNPSDLFAWLDRFHNAPDQLSQDQRCNKKRSRLNGYFAAVEAQELYEEGRRGIGTWDDQAAGFDATVDDGVGGVGPLGYRIWRPRSGHRAWMVIALGCWSSRTIWRPNCRLLSSVGGDTMTYNFVIKCVLSQGRRPLLLAVQRANYHCDRARFEQGVVRRS